MRNLLAIITILVFMIIASGCGTTPASQGVEPSGDTSAPGEALPSPTPLVLKTPTPKPAPPTPTPRPIPPTPEPQPAEAEEQQETQEQQAEAPAEPTSAVPAGVTDVMIEIPDGSFTMGSDAGDPEDAPAHEVDVPTFFIDQFEVTNADYAAFAEATGYQTFAEQQTNRNTWRDDWEPGVNDNHPVVSVTWNDANEFCQWLGKRLPTEAEWEKAARGTDGRAFPWGDAWDSAKANVKEAGLRDTVAVGSFGAGASPYSVDDLTGNVWEWTADWYAPYPGNTAEDPYYGEKFRVTRGGGWFDAQAQATAFNRNAADPDTTANDDLGFRCVR